MIKKLIGLTAFIFATVFGYAQQMQFVTVLSAPIGTFANLDTTPQARTQSPVVNFGTGRMPSGVVTLQGAVAPYLGTISLQAGTTLEGTNRITELRTDTLSLGPTGTINGSRLFAQFDTTTYGGVALPPFDNVLTVANTLSTNTMTVQVAAAGIFAVGSSAGTQYSSYNQGAVPTPPYMMWSNELQATYFTGGSTPQTSYAKEYLLTSDGTTTNATTGGATKVNCSEYCSKFNLSSVTCSGS